MNDNFSITIKNFKSYKEATLPLSPLTLLIGANASGKSNAVEAFRFLSWVAGGERLSTLKNRVNDSDKIIRGTVNDLVFSRDTDFELGFTTEDFSYYGYFKIANNEIIIFGEILQRLENAFYFINPDFENLDYLNSSFPKDKINSYIHEYGLQGLFASSMTDNEILFKGSKDDISILNYLEKKFSIFNYISLEKTITPELIEVLQNRISKIKVNFFFDFVPSQMRYESLSEKDLRSNGQNLAGVLYYLCEKIDTGSENKTKLLNLIKSLPEQNIIDIKFYVDHRERVEFALIENFGTTPKEFPMDLLSDGTLKVLAIATALLSVPVGSTLVIEEIDNSIHPSRANEILSLMRQYAEERNLKLLLSTHNPALMDAIPDEALADVVFCYRDPQQGDSRLVRLGDLNDYVGLVVQGSLGDLVTQGVVERFVKHPSTKEEKKQQALDWLKQMSR